jgi:hypothetical protein
MNISNPFSGKTYEHLTESKDRTGQRTMADCMAEDSRRVSTAFGLECTTEELASAYANLRSKTIPHQIAELAIRIGRIEKIIHNTKRED